MASIAQAVDLTWDASGPGDPAVTDGDGLWNLTDLTFFDGLNNVAWTNGNNAIFGASATPFNGALVAKNVDLNSAIEVQNLTFGNTTDGTVYNLSDFSGGTLTLNGNINKTSTGGSVRIELANGLTLGAGNHTIALHDSPGDAPAEMIINSVIGGSGGLTLDNTGYETWGTLVLAQANTFSGAASVANGRMVINNADALGSGSAAVSIGSLGTLSVGGAGFAASNVTINKNITISRNTYTGGEFGRYGAAFVSGNGSGTTTLAGTLTIDSTDARVSANSSNLVISNPIAVVNTALAATPQLSIGGDFAGFVKLAANNTAGLTNGVRIVGAQLDVDNDNQIGGPTAKLFMSGGVYHPVNGYATDFGAHVINAADFNGSINVDDGKVFNINQPLGPALGTANTVGSLSKRGTGTMNITSPVNLRGGFFFFDGGTVNISADMEISSLHLRSPVLNITSSVTGYSGYTSIGQDTTGTNGGPDIATINISGNGKLIQANDADFNVSDNANTKGTINISDNALLETTGINFLAKNPNTTAIINQTGGTYNVKRGGNFAFVLADARGGDVNVNGTYNLSGGVFTTNGEVYVGEGGAGAIGTWNQSGGTATISNWFVVGRESGSGDVTVSGGTLTKKGGGNTPIGEGTNARGNTFTVSGTGLFDAQTGEVWVSNGNTQTTMTVKDSGVFNVNNYYVVGRFGNSKGILNISDSGTINKAGANPFIVAAGGGSTGTVNQTGGTVNNLTTETWISDGGTAVYNISGGTMNLGLFDVGHNGGGSGILNVSGTAAINAGTLRIGEAGTVSGTINMNGGTLKAVDVIARNSTGAKTFNFNGGTLAAGTFNVGGALTNTGTGKVSPGLAVAGSTAITGTYTQGATAFMAIDLGGATAGSFDSVTATGAVSLAGRLDLALLSGYDPTILGAHTIISGSAVTGKFATIGGVIIPSNKRLAVTYTATAVNVTAARAGDANLDGTVNFDDLLTLAQNYSSTSSQWSLGDFDGDGATVFDDLLALAQNYGLSGMGLPTDLGSSVGSDVAADWALALSMVPEPSSLAVLGLSGLAFSRNRRR